MPFGRSARAFPPNWMRRSLAVVNPWVTKHQAPDPSRLLASCGWAYRHAGRCNASRRARRRGHRGGRIRHAAILDTYRLARPYLVKFFIRRSEFSLALVHFNAYVAFVPSSFFFFFA